MNKVSMSTGKKLHGLPLLHDLMDSNGHRILTAPPSMHNVMYVAQSVLDTMLSHVVPKDAPQRSAFGRYLSGAVGSNAHGKISASVATYRRLIAK